MPQIGLSSFSGGDTQKSCAQSKFEEKRLKIAPLMTDRTFSWSQNCPIPKSPLRGQIRNLGHYHLLDIITKEKPAKFQIKQTAVSIVMIPHNFCAPKRVSTLKGAQIGPKLVFTVLQREMSRNHVHSLN